MRRAQVILLAALGYSAVEFFALRGLAPLENAVQDRLLRTHAASRAPDPDIVLVSIDERSLEALAADWGRYPWPRSAHAELLVGILAQRPAAVLFDILFSDPDTDHPDADLYFVEVAAPAAQVYFPAVAYLTAPGGLNLDEQGVQLGFIRTPQAQPGARVALALPLRPLAETGRVGLINFLADGDGVGRRYSLYTAAGGWQLPSLPARVARDLGYVLPERSDIVLNWRGTPGSYRSISYADLLQDQSRGKHLRPQDELSGRIVIVGSNAAGLGDLRATPRAPLDPGPEIIATAMDNLKHGDWLRPVPAWLAAGATALLILALSLLFARSFGPQRIGAVLVLATLAVTAAAFGLLRVRWQAPVFTPLALAWLYYLVMAGEEYLRERAKRRHAEAVFARFVDPRVAASLVRDNIDALAAPGTMRHITLLFTDIRGFTTLSERAAPEKVVELLNAYFSRQVDIIFRHGGTVDKFIGDAIMAFWGAPVDDPQQADNAVRCALAMAAAVEEFRSSLDGLAPDFDIGIGLHGGPAVVGFIGSQHRLDYTAIGDAVNLASRIEGLTKGIARVLVSQAVREACGERFDFRDCGSHSAKGRAEQVRLYEPLRERE